MKLSRKVRKVFEELLEFYQSVGDVYRARAYLNALEDPSLTGKKLKDKAILIDSGKTLDELEVIRPLLKIAQIHGIGPKLVKKLMTLRETPEVRKILQDPRKLIQSGLVELTGAQKLALENYEELAKGVPRGLIEKYLRVIWKTVDPGIVAVGSFRRGKRKSGDVDLLGSPGEKYEVSGFPGFVGILSQGKSKTSFVGQYAGRRFQVDLLMIPQDEYWTSLLYFTGSKEFNVRMRGFAKRAGFLLNEHGLFRISGNLKKIPVESERDIFRIIGFPWTPPEDRKR
jgi:DNA polymerase/3'-5' exonuclease PolX